MRQVEETPSRPTATAAFAVTAVYWLGAAAAAWLQPSPGWLDLRWTIAISFFAAPLTAILWVAWAALRARRSPRGTPTFIAVGVMLPVLWYVVMVPGGRWLEARRRERDRRELATISIGNVSIEPFLTPRQHQIGIRIRYVATMPQGLSDQHLAPFADVRVEGSPSFTRYQAVVTPVAVSGRYEPGDYRFVEDFTPDILPRFLAFPELAASQAPSDRCFRWASDQQERAWLDGSAKTLIVQIHPDAEARDITYDPAGIHAGAIQEGATECH